VCIAQLSIAPRRPALGIKAPLAVLSRDRGLCLPCRKGCQLLDEQA
jgi:hypothetical protein